MHTSSKPELSKKERSREECYEEILDVLLEAVLILDENEIIYSNESAAELLGFDKPKEVIGMDPFTFLMGEEAEKVKEAISKSLKGISTPSYYELDIINRKGEKKKIQVLVSDIIYEGRTRFLAITRDVTKIKRYRIG